MTTPQEAEDEQWLTVESVMISQYAYTRFIRVEPRDVEAHITIWRLWYYDMVPWNAVMNLPGVHLVAVSGR